MINQTTYDSNEFSIIQDNVSDAIMMIGEEHSGKLHNNSFEINEFIMSVSSVFQMKLVDVEPPNNGLFNVDKHNCLVLEDYGVVIDTQIWQFTTKEPNNIEQREYIFEYNKYKKLGFKIKNGKKS